MAPDAKHRKDPTDPHLKFMTRSRRLISGTRDHMITIDRISAEIHELSRSIIADHEEFIRSRSDIVTSNESDDDVVQDIHIEREVSFETINETGSKHAKRGDHTSHHSNSLSVPVRYPDAHWRKEKSRKSSYKQDGNDSLGKQTKVRNTYTKLPYVPRVSDRNAHKTLARVYGVHQIQYVPHRVLPVVKVEPQAVHSGNTAIPPHPRIKLYKLKMDDKPKPSLPVLVQKPTNQTRNITTANRSQELEKTKEMPVIVNRPLPVYRAPVLVMQPPGNAPRTEQRLPPVKFQREEEQRLPPVKVQREESNSNIKVQREKSNSKIKETSPKKSATPRERTGDDTAKLPIISSKSASRRNNVRSGQTTKPPQIQGIINERSPYEAPNEVDLLVKGKTVNESRVDTSSRVPSRNTSSRSRDNTFRNTVKPRLINHLPKVKLRCSVSPDFTIGREYHRPSYRIRSPDSMSHIAPTASMESCGSVSPMPFVHQMTLTHRQTMLISGSSTPKRFLVNSRPGSIMRESTRPESITKLPKLFITAKIFVNE